MKSVHSLVIIILVLGAALMLYGCSSPGIMNGDDENYLQRLVTADLVDEVLNYSLMPNMIFAYNYPQQGFDNLILNYEGLAELMKREDAGWELWQRYQGSIPEDFSETGPLLELRYVETLLCQEEVLAGFSETQLIEILENALAKYILYQDNGANFYNLQSTAWFLGKVILQLGYPLGSLNSTFIETGDFATQEAIEGIAQQAAGLVRGQ